MTTEKVLEWIKAYLGPVIRKAIQDGKAKTSDLPYTEDWIAAITMRETGELIPGMSPVDYQPEKRSISWPP